MQTYTVYYRRLLAYLIGLIFLTGCSAPLLRNPVPPQDYEQVHVEGIDAQIRFWGDSPPANLNEVLAIKARQRKAHTPTQSETVVSYLALSGGGEDGAYGAGLLAGWTDHGDRPTFDVVTGISTGALIAPFAFLGSGYDQQLKRFYTTLSTDDLIITSAWKKVQAITGSSALTDTSPLMNIIADNISPAMFDQIAAEHNKGRRLYIGTTHLDAQRPVIWDIGALANTGHPQALDIFHHILVASASIPGVMPPVLFNVRHDNQRYQELHVDGGVTSQVFLYSPAFDLSDHLNQLPPVRKLYIIRNSKLRPQYEATTTDALSVSRRSISTLIKSQGIGDLYIMKIIADRDQLDYNLTYVDNDFEHEASEVFDPVYMSALFEYGYRHGRQGIQWKKSPDGTEAPH